MSIPNCPVCGAGPDLIKMHDALWYECPCCEARDSLVRWCEENTELPLTAVHTQQQAAIEWLEMCLAYEQGHMLEAA